MGRGSIVARERELQEISAFLDVDPAGGRALLLEGEAGIGKSALWRAGTELASRSGYRVLSCAAAASETQLAFTTLRDLLAVAFDEIAEDLPSPQRRALAIVLLREEPVEGPAEPATVAVAFLSTVRLLASRTPTLLAVDDVQWVDSASANVLRYVLRRLDEAHVDALLARRTANGSEPLLPGLQVLEVGPFSVGALGRILHDRLGLAYPRRTLQRVHGVSGGNPFYALEIARALGNTTTPQRPGEPLPVPGSLLQLVRGRLASLPAPTLEALTVASALSRPTLQSIGAALGSNVASALEPAVNAEIVQTDGTAVWFTHPLFAASVYALAAPRRREIHARLAPVVADAEERARHLAHATDVPDLTVARVVAAGATTAFARGAPVEATELATHARRLTPQDERDELWRLTLAESEYAFAAGDTGHAGRLLDELAGETPAGPRLARVLSSQARVRSFDRDISQSVTLLRRALEEAGQDAALRGAIEEGLAWALLLVRENLDAAAGHARSAASLAEERGDAAALAEALAACALIDFVLGRAWEETMHRALSLEDTMLDLRVLRHPSFAYGYCLTSSDELERARGVFEELLRRADRAGDEGSVPPILNHLTLVACLAGRWEEAAALADDCYERALEAGQQPTQTSILGKRALLAAHHGAVDEARESAWRALAPIGGQAFDPARPEQVMSNGGESVVGALGFLELMLGNAAETHRLLGPLCAGLFRAGIEEPGEVRCLADEIEALLALGRLDEAETLVSRYEDWARRLERRSALATAGRCRGLLLAARDDLGGAVDALAGASAWHEGVPLPFDHGRTLLALGTVQRRMRRRREARQALTCALAIFERLGAALFAERTRGELARIGGRSSAPDTLTPSEQRIAQLVADGKTNREVAATLVVADRTVESALTQIYRKLDVRSRTELARKIAPPA